MSMYIELFLKVILHTDRSGQLFCPRALRLKGIIFNSIQILKKLHFNMKYKAVFSSKKNYRRPDTGFSFIWD
jgi:hypothetical protein